MNFSISYDTKYFGLLKFKALLSIHMRMGPAPSQGSVVELRLFFNGDAEDLNLHTYA